GGKARQCCACWTSRSSWPPMPGSTLRSRRALRGTGNGASTLPGGFAPATRCYSIRGSPSRRSPSCFLPRPLSHRTIGPNPCRGRVRRRKRRACPESPLADTMIARPRSRALLRNFFLRELDNRYLGSVTGLAWALVHPLALLAVYHFVFTTVFRTTGFAGQSFLAFVAVALWPWLAAQEALQRG